MSLTEILKAHADQSAAKYPEVVKLIMSGAIDELSASELTTKALKTGDAFPVFNLPNAKGVEVSSKTLLEQGPLIVAFYRGGWCPYCNIELRALQDALPEFKNRGAQLVAISPEVPDNSLTTVEKNNLEFEVLTDKDNGFARSLNLAYQLPEDLVALYANRFKIDLNKSQQNDNNELPISATYVIDPSGKITYHFIEEDYKLRADPKAILEAL
ncbi:peroxiredoxin-like family protein [Psychroserpens luteolus]|uniref:peroxiredoxin-like family protein n=1 Tax=Psychroserpens luteolus TaxID=2855840 RepID=UPI001E2D1476|nr:peroxiredoxin-like family protein [Psychroserpens luteolus]MCD2258298.1 AhpC/TSA family protein [Psychroserpens luteolus]